MLLEDLKHKVINTKDKIRFFIARLLMDHKSLGKVTLPVVAKSVLFVRMDGKLGDTVVSSFVYRELKAKFPDMRIGVLTLPNIGDMYRNNQYIDDVYCLKKRPSFNMVREFCKKIITYEVVVYPVRWLKPRDIYLLRKLDPSIVVSKEERLNMVDVLINKGNKDVHESSVFKEILGIFGVYDYDPAYFIRWNDDAEMDVLKFVSKIGQNYIVLNPYGNSKSKKIPSEKTKEVIFELHKKCPKYVIVIIAAPTDFKDAKQVVDSISMRYLVMMDDADSIDHAISLISHAKLLVSVDTGTVHIATATKTPTVAIYRNDKASYDRWHPNSTIARTVFARPAKSKYEEVNIGEFDLEDMMDACGDLIG